MWLVEKILKSDNFRVCNVKRAIEAFFVGHPICMYVYMYSVYKVDYRGAAAP